MIKKCITLSILILLCFSCDLLTTETNKNEIETKPIKTKKNAYFEGVISLSKSVSISGSLLKDNTTYTLSKDYIKREQKLGGINSFLGEYAGIIVDLKKQSIVLYYVDKVSGKKNKHTTSIKNFKNNEKYKNLSSSSPTFVDDTFKYTIKDNDLIKHVKDSTEIKGFKADYSLYVDSSETSKQECFDSKEIKVKRELLDIVFKNLPKEINFLLKNDLRATFSNISNDSIVNNKATKGLDGLIRDLLDKKDKKTDLEKVSKNKWVKLGLNLIKKGIDLGFHMTTEVTEIEVKEVTSIDFSLPSLDFIEISDIDEFIFNKPTPDSGGFDDD